MSNGTDANGVNMTKTEYFDFVKVIRMLYGRDVAAEVFEKNWSLVFGGELSDFVQLLDRHGLNLVDSEQASQLKEKGMQND